MRHSVESKVLMKQVRQVISVGHRESTRDEAVHFFTLCPTER